MRMIRSGMLLLLVALAMVGVSVAAEPEGTLGKIKRSNAITLGYRESSRPFSFVGDGGKPAGYSADLCARVAAAIGKQLGLPGLQTRWVKVTVENRMHAVAGGTIDLECGSTPASLSRHEQVDFSLLTFMKWFGSMSTAGPLIDAMYLINRIARVDA